MRTLKLNLLFINLQLSIKLSLERLSDDSQSFMKWYTSENLGQKIDFEFERCPAFVAWLNQQSFVSGLKCYSQILCGGAAENFRFCLFCTDLVAN